MKDYMQLGSMRLSIEDYATQGNAIIGIKEAGKTYSATYFAEQLLGRGIPIIAFDPIGVWRYLKVPGKGPGFKIVVAGGEHGDLPLTPQTAPEIVEAAMEQNISLVLDLYSMEMSKADWRRIVEKSIRLLLYKNKKYGPRHVYLEEVTEFAPQKLSREQGQVYAEVEKLGRMGGNAYLGYTLIGQRAEEVNKAMLEICDSLFLHRQKGRNSLAALEKWLNYADPVKAKEIIKSMPLLERGECWVWGQGSDSPWRVQIPEKSSLHPDRRKKVNAPQMNVAPVDVSQFVSKLKTGLDEKTKRELDQEDPKALRARIAQLEIELKKKNPAVHVSLDESYAKELKAELDAKLEETVSAISNEMNGIVNSAKELSIGILKSVRVKALELVDITEQAMESISQMKGVQPIKGSGGYLKVATPLREVKQPSPEKSNGTFNVRHQKIVDAAGWLLSAGVSRAPKNFFAAMAGVSPKSSQFSSDMRYLVNAGLFGHAGGGLIEAMGSGIFSVARTAHVARPTLDQIHERWRVCPGLKPSQVRMIEAITEGPVPEVVSMDLLAEMSDQSKTSSAFSGNIRTLKRLGLVEVSKEGVIATKLLYPDGIK